MPTRELTPFEQRIRPGQLRYSNSILDAFVDRVHGRVLDFGCGVGAMMECIRSRTDARPMGVDIAYNDLWGSPFTRFGGRQLPFADDSFDVVLEIFALHHSPTLEENLAEMARVARDELILVEDVWTNGRNRFWLHFNHVVFDAFMVVLTWLGKAEWKTDFTYYFRDREGWLELFDRLGLRVVADDELILKDGDKVLHRVFVVSKRPAGEAQAAAAPAPESPA